MKLGPQQSLPFSVEVWHFLLSLALLQDPASLVDGFFMHSTALARIPRTIFDTILHFQSITMSIPFHCLNITEIYPLSFIFLIQAINIVLLESYTNLISDLPILTLASL